jgi:hypothetical protein
LQAFLAVAVGNASFASGAPNCTYENLGGNSHDLTKFYHQTTNQLKGNGAALIDLFE